MSQSKVTSTGIITDPDTPQAALIVEIDVVCPICGPGKLRIPGHHLRAVRDIAQMYCDSHPALTGGGTTVVSSETLNFRGRPPKDPGSN